jgi:hypothetical protein
MACAAPVSLSRVAYVTGVTYGVTPATPTFTMLRRDSGGLGTDKETGKISEINLDNRVRDEIELSQSGSGSYSAGLSYGSFDDLIAAGLRGSWAANVLTDGAVDPLLTFEETIDNTDGTFSYSEFLGAVVDGMDFGFESMKPVTFKVDIMAQKETLRSAIITGATYSAANTNVVETGNVVASLAVLGLSPVPTVKTLNISIKNNHRKITALGSKFPTCFGPGERDITGTIDAYFKTNTLYQKVLDHGFGAISFTVGTVTLKKYTFSMPDVVFLNGSRRLSGVNDDVMVSIPFRARGTAAVAPLTITRAVA